MTKISDPKSPIILRGKPISEDERGWICLDDIWELAEASPSQRPAKWKAGKAAIGLIQAVKQKIRNSALFRNKTDNTVIYAKRGRGSNGTFAHPILAAAYAGYLSSDLEVEVREIWLRYRAGDATLADEILQRASDEANKWAGVRALSRVQRRQFTDVLKQHDVEGKGYGACTDALYMNLLGARAKTLNVAHKVGKSETLRDVLPTDQLSYVMAAEALSAERIQEENRRGNHQCAEATGISASAIRNAIAADRRNRQPKLV